VEQEEIGTGRAKLAVGAVHVVEGVHLLLDVVAVGSVGVEDLGAGRRGLEL
jgi:hypothetical protein